MAASELIAAARGWLGVPYQHQGRTRLGVDCAGLVVVAFRDIGIEIPDRKAYGRQPFNGELENTAEIAFQRVGHALPGDCFLMSFAGRPTSHVAIYTGRTIIHSYLNAGRVVETDFIDGRPAKLKRIYRWQKQ